MTRRAVKMVGLLVVSWCVMVVSHELGHIVCGLACGGTLTDFDVLPWHLPYSFFEPDPSPLITVWGGPLIGVLFPWSVAVAVKKDWAWFVAYFCMLANGTYIASGWLWGDRYLDTQKLLEHGAHPVLIVIYCLWTIVHGYLGWRQRFLVYWKPET